MIEIDTHEPVLAFSYIGQAVDAKLVPLNDAGWADYKWEALDKVVHIERKTWKDLTGDLDPIEYQLMQEQKNHPEARLVLIVEGVAEPGPFGTVLYHPTKGNKRNVFYASTEQAARYSKIMAWLYQVQKFIEVYHTATLKGTCSALVAFYYGDQKDNHTTFERYLKTISWHPNPQVESLMGIGHGIGIGPSKAEALIKRFGTLYNVLTANPDQLQAIDGIGKVNALKLLRKAGRTDI